MEVFTVRYVLRNHIETAKLIAQSIGSKIQDNFIDVPSHIGDGFLEVYDFDRFSVLISKFKIKFDAKIVREYSNLEDHFIFDYIIKGNANKFVNSSEGYIGQLHYGCKISTPSTESYGLFEKDKWHYQVSILVKKSALEEYLNVDLPKVLHNPNQPLFLALELPIGLSDSLKYFLLGAKTELFRDKIAYHKSIEALVSTSGLLISRGENYDDQRKFHPDDVLRVTALRDHMIENLRKHFTIKELTELFNINKDKLQFIFKTIYGTTVAEYLKTKRMEFAHSLLLQGHNASEAGRSVGYTNLSHFARAFKSIYGHNPSEL